TAAKEYVRVINDSTIQGWMHCTPAGGGWGNGDGKANYTVYYFAQFSKPLKEYGVWHADIPDNWNRKREDVESARYQERVAHAEIVEDTSEFKGKHIGFYTEFATEKEEQV